MQVNLAGRILRVAFLATAFVYVVVHVHSATVSNERPTLIVASLIFSVYGLSHSCYMLGWRRALIFYALCVLYSYAGEEVAIRFELLGPLHYADVLGPKLDLVPVIIPLSWFMMIYPTYVMANLIVDGQLTARRSGVGSIVWLSFVAAVIQTGWSLSLDPLMVHGHKAWTWTDGGAYFGIPIMKYVWSIQIAFVVNFAYRLLERRIALNPLGPVTKFFGGLPIVIYAMNGTADALAGMPEATRLIPLFVMGIPILVALSRLVEAKQPMNEAGAVEVDREPGVDRGEAAIAPALSRGLDRALLGLLTLLVILQLALHMRPLFEYDRVPFVVLTPIFALFSLLHSAYVLGWRRALVLFVSASSICLGAELIGTRTGAIFGPYEYTEVLGPKILGLVPYIIPMAWYMMLYPSLIVTNLMLDGQPHAKGGGFPRILWLSFVGALVMTAWDLTLDPYMVGFDRAWVWEVTGPYFGVPFKNYRGWALTTFVVFVVYRTIEQRIDRRPWGTQTKYAVALPVATYALLLVGDVVIGQPEASIIISPFAMGFPVIIAATRLVLWNPAPVQRAS